VLCSYGIVIAMPQAKSQLNERHQNLLEQLTLVAVGSLLVGRPMNVKLRGSQAEINAVADAINASKTFQESLQRSGASVDDIMLALERKNAASAAFERTMGVRFPL